MGNWTRVQRRDAGSNALESDIQSIFDAWGTSNMLAAVAGAPDWLWALGKPAARAQRVAYGYRFTPDVEWHDRAKAKAVVADLKYGTKFEPIAIGEVLHHAHMLRQLDRLSEVTPLVITQYNGWIRAAVHEVKSSNLRHLEIDLLEAFGQQLLWVTDPHAAVTACSAPKDLPLDEHWSARKWWRVEGEETWLVQEEMPQQPFNGGRLAIISKVRSTSQGYVLWSGQMPALGDDWDTKKWRAAGTYWAWSPEGDSKEMPPLP